MIVIGIDPHKATHTAVAVDGSSARTRGERTARARQEGFGELMAWARALADELIWALEDCRHVSGSLERFLLAHGEKVIPDLAAAHGRRAPRTGSRTRQVGPDRRTGRRARSVRDGIDAFPRAQLAGRELEIRLLHDHRARLVADRTAL